MFLQMTSLCSDNHAGPQLFFWPYSDHSSSSRERTRLLAPAALPSRELRDPDAGLAMGAGVPERGGPVPMLERLPMLAERRPPASPAGVSFLLADRFIRFEKLDIGGAGEGGRMGTEWGEVGGR